jgi:monoamine oxidase
MIARSASPSSDFDIVVIGAGAAGIAAAMRLASSERSFCVLEARSRIGGRAYTRVEEGFPLDLGCGWLHSADRNPWRPLIEESGFAIDKTRPPWGILSIDLDMDVEKQRDFDLASARFQARLDEAGRAEADRPAAQLLEPDGRWNALLNAVSTYVSGVELDRVSARDSGNYADSGVNWRVVEGYGAGIRSQAKQTRIEHDCAVELIDRTGPRLKLVTRKGDLTADSVILTVPTSILATEKIRFRPPLPEKVEAACMLPLGLADKLLLAIDDPDMLPKEGHVFGNLADAETASYHMRPFGRPLIEAYFGGRLAQKLEAEGTDAFFDFACVELAHVFGHRIKPRLRPITQTSWGLDPYALGSYSYALPNHAIARLKLAETVDDRLFFAGEACSPNDFSTAHGAFWTGVKAAERALARADPDHARRSATS